MSQDDLALLLPLHAAGTLSAEEAARIEAALAVDPDLRAEWDEVVALQSLIKSGGAEWSHGDAEARLDRLFDRIEAEAPRAAQPRAARRFDWSRLFLPLGAALAAGALAVTLTLQVAAPRERFEVAGGPRASGAEQAIALLRPAETTRWRDLEALLRSERLHIISGPKDGLLEVAPDAPLSDPAKRALVTRLKSTPLIAFCGPAV